MDFAPRELKPRRNPTRLFFRGDETGSALFRIPFLLSAADGTLIAGCDANFGSGGDSAENIDAVIRRRPPGRDWEPPFLPPVLHLLDYADEPGYRQKSSSFIDGMLVQDALGVGTPGRLLLHIDGWVWNGGLFEHIYPHRSRRVARGDGFAAIGGRKYLLLSSQNRHGSADGARNNINRNVDRTRFDYAADLWGPRDERGHIAIYRLCGTPRPSPRFGSPNDDNLALGERSEYALNCRHELSRNGEPLLTPQKTEGDAPAGRMVPTRLLYEDSPLQMLNTSYLYQIVSDDGGASWRLDQIISGMCKREGSGAYLTGPGRGIQLTGGPHRGRLLFPTYFVDGGRLRSEAIWSDDGGASWRHGGAVPTGGSVSESALVELPDGSVAKFMRNVQEGGRVLGAVSRNGGESWSRPRSLFGDSEPGVNCQLSAIRYSRPLPSRQGGVYPAILLSTPFHPARTHGMLFVGLVKPSGGSRFSIDWEYQVELTGPDTRFAYSCLTELPDGKVGILYETSPTPSWDDGLQSMTYEEFALPL